jgi:hypothetical protein
MKDRKLEKTISAASFAVAVLLAFVSMYIREDHDITANVLLAMAQFLTLCCTLLGIDYKFNQIKVTKENGKETHNMVA